MRPITEQLRVVDLNLHKVLWIAVVATQPTFESSLPEELIVSVLLQGGELVPLHLLLVLVKLLQELARVNQSVSLEKHKAQTRQTLSNSCYH